MPQTGGAGEVSRRIYTEVALNGEKLRPLLDTGDPWPLTIDHGTGKALGLWSDQHPYVPVRLKGIAGALPAPARLVRAANVSIGPATLANPLVVVRPPQAPITHAVLGLPVIRTVNLSIDAKLGLLWVKRNALEIGPTNYAGSGVWVDEKGGKVVVGDVGVGSPAAKAGVQVGDVILDANTVAEAVPRINSGRGVPTTLKLGRGGQVIEATYSPASYRLVGRADQVAGISTELIASATILVENAAAAAAAIARPQVGLPGHLLHEISKAHGRARTVTLARSPKSLCRDADGQRIRRRHHPVECRPAIVAVLQVGRCLPSRTDDGNERFR